ncbi:multidrug transporter [Robiginitalea sp. IMCC43444]|uniref:multidrug transporter n=1 Tax=Robiginitalea sp. IMCC43444 TaxID=3459121 RepID=UPI004041DA69
MKKYLLFLGFLALCITISCESDDTAQIIINDIQDGEQPGDQTVNLSGVYTEDLTLDVNTDYLVSGPVLMASGTTLTIPAGMTIRFQPVGVNAFIAIQQGAQINASGTPSQPIIFTSSSTSPGAGDWGGLVICGTAPINSTADGSADTATSEVGNLSYGGNSPADNSGTLQYVRIEYAGGAIDGNAELNGLSLYGVGNGTVIDHIQIFEGSDDGVEFFGGTVNVSQLVVVNSEDDSVDWTEGYTGTLTDVYIQHGVSHDKAFECDGYNVDFNNAGGYFSRPNINNVTVLGANDGSEAIRLRAGTQGLFNNVLLIDFDEAFDLDGDTGDNPTGQGVLDGFLSVTDVTFTNVTTKLKNDTGFTFDESDFISGDGNGSGTDVSSWGAGWTVGIR